MMDLDATILEDPGGNGWRLTMRRMITQWVAEYGFTGDEEKIIAALELMERHANDGPRE